jgi:hypothetical protein
MKQLRKIVLSLGEIVSAVLKVGISFGGCVAIVVSYTAWHSILWAIFHGVLSWAYVIYYAIRYLGK